MSATSPTPVIPGQSPAPAAAAVPSEPRQSRHGPYDVCFPPESTADDADPEAAVIEMQREMDDFRDCVNAELKVRSESSLLGLILFKILVPFAAIAAGLTAFYITLVRFLEARGRHFEVGLGIGYLIFAIIFLWIWYTTRHDEGAHAKTVGRLLSSTLNLRVPARKEKLTRNPLVNGWIFSWLTWGVLIMLPLMFLLFRSNTVERLGARIVLVTGEDFCAPTEFGYNPYEGAPVCDGTHDYRPVPPITTGTAPSGIGPIQQTAVISSPLPTDQEVNDAEIRIDVTTTLIFFFLILLIGIVVNMMRWWLRQRRASRAPPQPADAPAGTSPA